MKMQRKNTRWGTLLWMTVAVTVWTSCACAAGDEVSFTKRELAAAVKSLQKKHERIRKVPGNDLFAQQVFMDVLEHQQPGSKQWALEMSVALLSFAEYGNSMSSCACLWLLREAKSVDPKLIDKLQENVRATLSRSKFRPSGRDKSPFALAARFDFELTMHQWTRSEKSRKLAQRAGKKYVGSRQKGLAKKRSWYAARQLAESPGDRGTKPTWPQQPGIVVESNPVSIGQQGQGFLRPPSWKSVLEQKTFRTKEALTAEECVSPGLFGPQFNLGWRPGERPELGSSFVTRATGYLDIPKDGLYLITFQADTGGILLLADTPVVDAWSGATGGAVLTRPAYLRSGRVPLTILAWDYEDEFSIRFSVLPHRDREGGIPLALWCDLGAR